MHNYRATVQKSLTLGAFGGNSPKDDALSKVLSHFIRTNVILKTDYFGIPMTIESNNTERGSSAPFTAGAPETIDQWYTTNGLFENEDSYTKRTPKSSTCIVVHWGIVPQSNVGMQLFTGGRIWTHTSPYWDWRKHHEEEENNRNLQCVMIRIPSETPFDFGVKDHNTLLKKRPVRQETTTVMLPPSQFLVRGVFESYVLVDLVKTVEENTQPFVERLNNLKNNPMEKELVSCPKLVKGIDAHPQVVADLDETWLVCMLEEFGNGLKTHLKFEWFKRHSLIPRITPAIAFLYVDSILDECTTSNDVRTLLDKSFFQTVCQTIEKNNDYSKKVLYNMANVNTLFEKLLHCNLLQWVTPKIGNQMLLRADEKDFIQIIEALITVNFHVDHLFYLKYVFEYGKDVDPEIASTYTYDEKSSIDDSKLGPRLWKLRKPTQDEFETQYKKKEEWDLFIFVKTDEQIQEWFEWFQENNYLSDVPLEYVQWMSNELKPGGKHEERLKVFVKKKLITLDIIVENRLSIKAVAEMFKVSDTRIPTTAATLLAHRKPTSDDVTFLLENKYMLLESLRNAWSKECYEQFDPTGKDLVTGYLKNYKNSLGAVSKFHAYIKEMFSEEERIDVIRTDIWNAIVRIKTMYPDQDNLKTVGVRGHGGL